MSMVFIAIFALFSKKLRLSAMIIAKSAIKGRCVIMNDDKKELAQRIINIRENLSMTQAELAQRTGLERTALNKIEKGTRKVSSDELKSIALALGVTADDLLGITSNNKDNSDDTALTWDDLGVPMPYGGHVPDELKETYSDIAKGYFKRHPEFLNKNE